MDYFIKLVNITLLIVIVWSQVKALSHKAGVLAGSQFGYAAICL
jgi:hypothetical protein